MIQLSAEILSLSSEAALLAKNGRIVYGNDAAARILGDGVVGKSLRNVLCPEIAEAQAPAFLSEVGVGERRYLVRVSTSDGMRVLFLSPCTIAQSLLNDAFLYALRSFLMEMQVSILLLRSNLEKRGAADGAEELNSLYRSFYRIGNILFNLHIIRDEAEGNLCFHPQPFDFSALLRELTEAIRHHLPEAKLRLSVPERLDVCADAEMLQRLVINLVSNCLRHAAGYSEIHIHVHEAGDKLILSVDDDGCGIPAGELSGVFDRYAHGFDLTGIGRGAGLGLSCARAIARLHGGTLLLESREGIGTAVRVSLSRDPKPVYPVGNPGPRYEEGFNGVLAGLADCLPPGSYSEAYTE